MDDKLGKLNKLGELDKFIQLAGVTLDEIVCQAEEMHMDNKTSACYITGDIPIYVLLTIRERLVHQFEILKKTIEIIFRDNLTQYVSNTILGYMRTDPNYKDFIEYTKSIYVTDLGSNMSSNS